MKSIFLAFAILLGAALPSAGAVFVQATVTSDTAANTYDFQVVWSTPPDFTTDSFGRPADSARFLILSPTAAAACCAPYGDWSGYAQANADYSIFLPAVPSSPSDQVSVYSGFLSSLTGNLPFVRSGNAVEFEVPFGWINEPSRWVYEFETYQFGVWNGNAYVGMPNGAPAQIAGIPEPSTWAMTLVGFAGLGFIARRGRRKFELALSPMIPTATPTSRRLSPRV